MKHYLVLTDINSRQYPIQIPENGIEVSALNFEPFLITQLNTYLYKLSALQGKVLFGNILVIDFSHVVSIQYQEIPDDAV